MRPNDRYSTDDHFLTCHGLGFGDDNWNIEPGTLWRPAFESIFSGPAQLGPEENSFGCVEIYTDGTQLTGGFNGGYSISASAWAKLEFRIRLYQYTTPVIGTRGSAIRVGFFDSLSAPTNGIGFECGEAADGGAGVRWHLISYVGGTRYAQNFGGFDGTLHELSLVTTPTQCDTGFRNYNPKGTNAYAGAGWSLYEYSLRKTSNFPTTSGVYLGFGVYCTYVGLPAAVPAPTLPMIWLDRVQLGLETL